MIITSFGDIMLEIKEFINCIDSLPNDGEDVIILQTNGANYRTQLSRMNTHIFKDGEANRYWEDTLRDGYKTIAWRLI